MFLETIESDAIENMPQAVFQGEIVEVSSLGQLQEAVNYLSDFSVIGFDTETKPCFSAGQSPRAHTALLQLSTEQKAFLIHLKHTGIPVYLANLLSNPKIVKVGAAVKDDVRGLQYYRRFEAGGFVDLQNIAENYGVKDKSVKKMAAIVLGLKVSKAQRLSNWEALPLNESQKQYAAIDAYVCCKIFKEFQKID